jgi:hypothetical protein
MYWLSDNQIQRGRRFQVTDKFLSGSANVSTVIYSEMSFNSPGSCRTSRCICIHFPPLLWFLELFDRLLAHFAFVIRQNQFRKPFLLPPSAFPCRLEPDWPPINTVMRVVLQGCTRDRESVLLVHDRSGIVEKSRSFDDVSRGIERRCINDTWRVLFLWTLVDHW